MFSINRFAQGTTSSLKFSPNFGSRFFIHKISYLYHLYPIIVSTNIKFSLIYDLQNFLSNDVMHVNNNTIKYGTINFKRGMNNKIIDYESTEIVDKENNQNTEIIDDDEIIEGEIFDEEIIDESKIKEADAIFERNAEYYIENYAKVTNFELLEDFPAWLTGIGLKLISPNFKDKDWREIIQLNEADLEHIGIRHKNIRKRLVKHFAKVQRDLEVEKGIILPPKPKELTGYSKLHYKIKKDIEARLHMIDDGCGNYYPYLQGLKWDDLLFLDDEKLENMGIRNPKIRKILSNYFASQRTTPADLEHIGIRHKNIRKRLVKHFAKVQRDLEVEKGIILPPKPKELTGYSKLHYKIKKDIEARLHMIDDGCGNYYPYLQGLKWDDLLFLDDEKLENMGIRNPKIRKILSNYFASQRTTPLIDKKALSIFKKKLAYYRSHYEKRTDFKLLKNFPVWLDGLGLKILAPRFKGKTWQEIIEMNTDDLDELGIYSMELKKRLIKHFNLVKKSMNEDAQEQILEMQENYSYKDKDLPIDRELLQDLTCWFHSFKDGLGNYSPFFKNKKWNQVIDMTNKDLELMGLSRKIVRHAFLMGFKYYKNALIVNEEADKLYEQVKNYHKKNYIEETNFELLEDFPLWLEGAGLKPLAPRFEGIPLQDILEFNEQDLENLGIYNKNLRKRLIYHFQKVQRDLASLKGLFMKPPKIKKKDKYEQIDDLKNFRPDYEIMKDLPCWFNTIHDQLGNYWVYFQGKKWQEIIDMENEDLESLGIRSPDIRQKFMRGFKNYKQSIAAEKGILIDVSLATLQNIDTMADVN
ncbi:hypothetical protein Glove_208g211 [Diversispora epigaea]|uniref:SAM domain-containing protein n=1 Tax=Diversispora epigaea TaxID=1348612 RepID=A0A397ISF1_9GLOM|nr:hypothetical protein Glove_208g211 [Diversispora epigaea]